MNCFDNFVLNKIKCSNFALDICNREEPENGLPRTCQLLNAQNGRPVQGCFCFFELENDDDVNIADLVVSVELFCRGGTQKSVPIKASTSLPGGKGKKKVELLFQIVRIAYDDDDDLCLFGAGCSELDGALN